MQRMVLPVARIVYAVEDAARRWIGVTASKTANNDSPDARPEAIDSQTRGAQQRSATVRSAAGLCGVCGHSTGDSATCRRCGNYVRPEAAGAREPWLYTPWVAAIVVLGLAVLSYLLPIVAWALEGQLRQ